MNFAHILNATHTAIVKGADVDAAARAAFPVIANVKVNIETLLADDRASALTGQALAAANVTIAAGLRAILAADGVDVNNGKAVRDALRPEVWADEGQTMPEAGSAKPDEGTEARATYDRIAQRVSRLAVRVVAAPKAAPQKVAVRVPKAVQTSIDALIAEHGAAIVREALKRAAK